MSTTFSDDDFEDELSDGLKAATAFAAHVSRMGSARAGVAVKIGDNECWDVIARRADIVPPELPTDPLRDHILPLGDDEKETLIEMLKINDAHFAELTRESVVIASVPQTPNIIAYRRVLQRILAKVESC